MVPAVKESGDPLGSGGAHRAVDQKFPARFKIKFALHKADLDPRAVKGNVQVHDQVHYDLAESQCDDGEVVALELQDRDTDEEAYSRGEQHAHDDRKDQTGDGRKGLCQQAGDTDTGKGTDCHESRLSQIKFAGNADVEVKADRRDQITGGGDQQALKQIRKTS